MRDAFLAFKKYQEVHKTSDILKFGTPIFMTVNPFYGCFGEVIDTSAIKKSSRIKGNYVKSLE